MNNKDLVNFNFSNQEIKKFNINPYIIESLRRIESKMNSNSKHNLKLYKEEIEQLHRTHSDIPKSIIGSIYGAHLLKFCTVKDKPEFRDLLLKLTVKSSESLFNSIATGKLKIEVIKFKRDPGPVAVPAVRPAPPAPFVPPPPPIPVLVAGAVPPPDLPPRAGGGGRVFVRPGVDIEMRGQPEEYKVQDIPGLQGFQGLINADNRLNMQAVLDRRVGVNVAQPGFADRINNIYNTGKSIGASFVESTGNIIRGAMSWGSVEQPVRRQIRREEQML